MESKIQSYRDLEVWKKSIQLVKEIYLITKSYPCEEMYGLTSQMRRAAVSIPSNIAEGRTRQTKKEYVQFLHIARGSIAELETHLVISRELSFIDKHQETKLSETIDHISRMLWNLIKSLQSGPRTANRLVLTGNALTATR